MMHMLETLEQAEQIVEKRKGFSLSGVIPVVLAILALVLALLASCAGVAMLDPNAPESTVPESIAPELTIPEPNTPKPTAPGSTTPEPAIPELADTDSQPLGEHITIKGVEYSTLLTSLVLGGSELSNEDIVPLQYMSNLHTLSISGTLISDISPLSGLANMERLELNHNQISDISPLSGLTKLTHLDLFANAIIDWSAVAHIESVYGRP